MIQFKRKTLSVAVAVTCAAITAGAMASSHREAPNITRHPALDSTDFYAFNSYEEGREGYVTFIANYIPLQDAYGGPNYFACLLYTSTSPRDRGCYRLPSSA